ncbi:MAG TPA: sigma-70 family RNA polymerase sigma factor [Longimicrobium sp.]|jgi:RNA polymerase sigma-70 factor (ECF subfamily)
MHPPQSSPAYQDTKPVLAADGDAGLVRRMAAGDEAALGLLYDRWSPMLHSVALRIVGDPADAEEVLEETFWQAWRQAGRFEETRGGVSTWLSMMLRSRALDRVRARGRLREDRWDSVMEPARAGEDTRAAPDSHAEQDEMRRLVTAAVAQLPAEQRQTVELAYFRGMSQTEIAAALGQPLGTVKTRARLALQKLREALGVLREEEGR